MSRLGDLLIQKGIITQQQLELALKESKETGELIGKMLVRMKFITNKQLLRTLGEQLSVPFYEQLKEIVVSPKVIQTVPAKLVWHYQFMPIELNENTLTIAVSDPLAVWLMEDLKLHLGYEVKRVLAQEDEILSAIKRYYGVGSDTVEEILTKEDLQTERKSAA